MKDKIASLAKRFNSIKNRITTEEGTKQSLILPMLTIMGYDVSNPYEVMPEVSCDIAKSKGERIDYVIYKDGNPSILLECKHWQHDLNSHVNQLRRYFVASDARFAILTNGIIYRFYSDHDKENIMDENPFHTIDIRNITDNDIDLLSSFSKDSFKAEKLISKSQEMKYRAVVLDRLHKEFANPSKGLVRLLTSGLYEGKLYDSLYNKFSWIIKDCLALLISDDATNLIKDIGKAEKVDENGYKYNEDEQRIIDVVMNWLNEFETEQFKIYIRKLSNGYLRFCYLSEWWNICRIKVRWDKSLDVLICKGALAANSVKMDVPNIASLNMIKDAVVKQCIDTKNRLIKYRENHNCNR